MDPLLKASEPAQYLYDQWHARTTEADIHARMLALLQAFYAAIDTVARPHHGLHLGIIIYALETLAEGCKEDIRTRWDRSLQAGHIDEDVVTECLEDRTTMFRMVPPD